MSIVDLYMREYGEEIEEISKEAADEHAAIAGFIDAGFWDEIEKDSGVKGGVNKLLEFGRRSTKRLLRSQPGVSPSQASKQMVHMFGKGIGPKIRRGVRAAGAVGAGTAVGVGGLGAIGAMNSKKS